ncbi:alanine--tRNA ligase [Chitinivibrio alkaliphilus]|uniref:Alanine--tRNA ligase n=1 Tax=Chitinivibrio alkaliphilus ACht1 TaxID=1313304 RepID=U7D8J9_9BACT|nr:alanine--tRNA ligase [Chitinivibrio alkaliphilus]ERP31881.1 alanyl-tRNA synthetase [Chitinivibrio alkaliphilus ACht1]
MKQAKDIRDSYIRFFTERAHTFVKSSPVAPQDDPTLLFTNAGMNQFKSIFLGDNPKNLSRAVNSQKCMRVSGKHNDLEEVGVDHHHHTFFEMLGNWSFGDYYKKEAIKWAWELITDVWGLPKEKVYATVYTDDDDAYEIWNSETDIDPARIGRHGAEDNFWEMGETGPCGPCSEIHFDTGEGTCIYENDPNHTCGVNVEGCGRYVEIWNLVFMQYNRQKDGTLTELSAKHIDTGMGFERIVRVIQGVRSNYETDLFMPLIEKMEALSGKTYEFGEAGIPFRVIADHMRALVFSITDGVSPSNDGQGYVIRRILRRAYRYGRKLGFTEPFMHRLVPVVVSSMGEAFPEVAERADYVASVIEGEEARFDKTLETGLTRLEELAEAYRAAGKGVISGADVFLLYGTYGFPADLTALIAREYGLEADEEGFAEEMRKQKAHDRSLRAGGDDQGLSPDGWTILSHEGGTVFTGYDTARDTVQVKRYKCVDDHTGLAVLDKTPFYAEKGGQCGDRGEISFGDITLSVVDTIVWNDMIVHKLVSDVPLQESWFTQAGTAVIDTERREAIRRNHSATHLLQAALTEVLGDHVDQAGSRVDAESLRFDFTHFSALSSDEIVQVERLVHRWIMEDTPVAAEEKSIDAAKKEGAKALFGEKYGDTVRVVSMGEFSKELCGGTHIDRLGKIGPFKITGESSVSAGVRRVEAVSGAAAVELFQQTDALLKETATLLKVPREALPAKGAELIKTIRQLERELKEYTAQSAGKEAGEILAAAEKNRHGGVACLARNVGELEKDQFTAMVDEVSDRLKQPTHESVAVVLGAAVQGKAMVAALAGAAAAKILPAGEVVKAAASKVQGGGGGSPVRAQAGGKDPAGLDAAMEAAVTLMQERFSAADE